MTVLDLGTGPYALFALQAAQAGAGKVFAIEGNPYAAAVARQTIKKAGYDDGKLIKSVLRFWQILDHLIFAFDRAVFNCLFLATPLRISILFTLSPIFSY